jgi:hypothetical protein
MGCARGSSKSRGIALHSREMNCPSWAWRVHSAFFIQLERGKSRMNCLRLCSLLVFTVAVATAVPVVAQIAPPPAAAPGAPPAGPRGPRPAPTNIKALPKNISGEDLIKLMHQYEGDLGVDCSFCHAQNPTTHRTDFASDANPVKDTARFMITMTDDLNNKYLESMPGRRYADPITCGTCHRGDSHPSIFVPKPQARPAGSPPAPGATPVPPPAARP